MASSAPGSAPRMSVSKVAISPSGTPVRLFPAVVVAIERGVRTINGEERLSMELWASLLPLYMRPSHAASRHKTESVMGMRRL